SCRVVSHLTYNEIVTSRKIYQINHTLNNFSKFLFIVELKTLQNPEPFFPEFFPVPSVRFPTPGPFPVRPRPARRARPCTLAQRRAWPTGRRDRGANLSISLSFF